MSSNCSHFYFPFFEKNIQTKRKSSRARSRAPTNERAQSRRPSPPAQETKMAFGAGGSSAVVCLTEKLHGQSMKIRRSAPRFWFRPFEEKLSCIKMTKEKYDKNKSRRADIALRLRFCVADRSPTWWSSGYRAPIIAEESRSSEVKTNWISHPAWISIWYQAFERWIKN